MEKVYWMQEMTWPEFADLVKETDIALIPVGTMEEHAGHSPLGTDTFTAEAVATSIAKEVKAVVAPSIPYGHGIETFDTTGWPGTLSISTETMSSFYRELGDELVRHGLNRILFVSGHYNQRAALTTAAFRIWKDTGAVAGILEWFIAAHSEMQKYAKVSHADQVETAVLLASEKSHLVQMDKAVANPYPIPPFEDEQLLWDLRLFGLYTYAQDEKYLYKGNLGDPSKATKEIGVEMINKATKVGLTMLEAMKKHVNKEKIERFRNSFK